jgi:hypothetical protein
MTTQIIPTMVRGSLKPDLTVSVSDTAASANFGAVTKNEVTVICEVDGEIVATGHPDTYTPAGDNKSATVVRAWVAGETDNAGRMWVSVRIDWPTAKPQTFPHDGPLRLDIVRAAGDA